MNQKYFKADGTEQGQSAGPDIGKLLDMLKEKLAGISQPIIPTKRKDQIEGQERAAESPEAKPAPTPTPKPAAKPKKKHDGWVDAGYGTGPLNAQGLQWQGAPPAAGDAAAAMSKGAKSASAGGDAAPPMPGMGGGDVAPPVPMPMPPMPAGQPQKAGGKIGGNPGYVGPPVPQPGTGAKAGAAGQGSLAAAIGAAGSGIGKKKTPAAPEFRPPGMLGKG